MVIDGEDEKETEKDSERNRELYIEQSQACLKHFEKWSETQQVEFVEYLLSKMCHYQHGHINSYLKPMLQRDFITALPGKLIMPFLGTRTGMFTFLFAPSLNGGSLLNYGRRQSDFSERS